MATIPRDNKAYRLRFEAVAKMLGIEPAQKEGEDADDDLPPDPNQKPKGISRHERQQLSFKALVAEGRTLYNQHEYQRAIDTFTSIIDSNKYEDNSILIDRANCYIKVGSPDLALEDVNKVLAQQSENIQAILTKAEAYFSMGEFEFALVFFQRGLSIRSQLQAFKDGAIKSKNAILDAINGNEMFQLNPNFATSRPRKALLEVTERSVPQGEDEEEQKRIAALLPEKVAPLKTTANSSKFLSELALDYEYLTELKAEVELNIQQAQATEGEDQGATEDEQVAVLVDNALKYLGQRGAFWSQQGQKENETSKERSTPVRSSKTKTDAKQVTEKSPKAKKTSAPEQRVGMTKIEQFEAKYGKPTSEA